MEPNCHVVYLCGCTDCFPHAIFNDESEAVKWAIENNKNPEMYVIEEIYLKEFDID